MTGFAFGEPAALLLSSLPLALLVVWAWRFWRRQVELGRLVRRRIVPQRERFRPGGELTFWLAQILALALLALSLARPLAPAAVPRRAGLDIVVLQDASASMRVEDVSRVAGSRRPDSPAPRDRWQRSMQFLRELGDSLSWHGDRIAMTIFAHIATPQIRLTRDPNTLFFFLDHLRERPPFRLEDDTTWDTNLELAVWWGLRMVEKDEEIHGRSQNATVFVLLSDGESWSGEVAQALARAGERGVPVHVIGVGTLAGGPLPAVTVGGEHLPSPGVSRLEPAALARIAAAAGGEYFELDRETDREIANIIISSGRRLAPSPGFEETADELYWWCLLGAAAASALGLFALRRPAELVIVLAGAMVAAVVVGPRLW